VLWYCGRHTPVVDNVIPESQTGYASGRKVVVVTLN
jgi:hypothetical protein